MLTKWVLLQSGTLTLESSRFVFIKRKANILAFAQQLGTIMIFQAVNKFGLYTKLHCFLRLFAMHTLSVIR